MATDVPAAVAKKKLIEVSLPLDAINAASSREKSIRHGHPSTLHLWWARRPLAAARAVLFAQLVDDPSGRPDLFPDEESQDRERQRLFGIIERLVQWENTTNEALLEDARREIRASWRRTCDDNRDHPRAADLFDPDRLPAFHDPFAGGGAIPLEAQRLGLEAHASDLNPVAVLINKAMIEIPPKFAGQAPVHPEAGPETRLAEREWRGALGLAEDVRYYGRWMRDEAERRIGHLYPKLRVTAAMAGERPDLAPYVGRDLTVIAWLWARTVKSPNPAFADVEVPLASTFVLSKKAGKEAYVEPVIEGGRYRFTVKAGSPPASAGPGTTAGKRSAFRCLMSGVPVTYDHIRTEGQAGRMRARLMAIVAEGDRGRVYLSPAPDHEQAASAGEPIWKPETVLPDNPRDFKTPNYGMTTFGDLFTDRQLVALNTFSDLVVEARDHVRADAVAAGLPDDGLPLRDGRTGATAYGEAVGVYLAFAISKLADRGSTICTWFTERDSTRNTFARQSIPMTWDYAELNTLLDGTGSFMGATQWTAESVEGLATDYGSVLGAARQVDAAKPTTHSPKVVSTDPPYYDNIGYGDLSDFFYVWLRRSLGSVFPSLFATLAVPKAEELIATPYRHKNKREAEAFFLDGMTEAMRRLAAQTHPAFPVTIYYAFKQSEAKRNGETASTGWETFLGAVIDAGFAISGTLPMRTELGNRMLGYGTNVLASSVVLVCRPRPADAPVATRREFMEALRAELPGALRKMQAGNIAPVDLAQAAIGPGMAVFTRYSRVLSADGRPLSVRDALALVNQTLDETLAEQEGDFDADTRWALAWFEASGFAEGEYGRAETLATAKNTSVAGMVTAGILRAGAGKVALLRPADLPEDWDPQRDARLTVWEMVHHLVRVHQGESETAAGELLARIGAGAEPARELAYRLYRICEQKKWAQEALAYNALIRSWPEIARLAREQAGPEQAQMFE